MAAGVGPCDEADHAGRSAQAEYDRRYAQWRTSRVQASLRVLPIALGFALLGGWYLAATTDIRLFGVVFALFLLGVVGDVLFRPPQALRDLRQTATGERATGRLLGRAGQRAGYLVLHDRSTAGGLDVEHLVIGPGGMFLLDSENWAAIKSDVRVLSGRLWIGRDPQNDRLDRLRDQAEAVAREVATALDGTSEALPAAPALVIHGTRVGGSPRMVNGVAVLESSQLLPYLSRSNTVWNPGRTREVATAAERVLRPKSGG